MVACIPRPFTHNGGKWEIPSMKETRTHQDVIKENMYIRAFVCRLSLLRLEVPLCHGGQGQQQVKAHGDYPDHIVLLPCQATPAMHHTKWSTLLSLQSYMIDRSCISSTSSHHTVTDRGSGTRNNSRDDSRLLSNASSRNTLSMSSMNE